MLIVFVFSAAVITGRAQSSGKGSSQIVDPPIPKGAVRLVVRNDAEAKKVFTYFPYPRPSDWYHPDESYPHPPDIGIYRIEVTPEGTVSAVTILKSANRMMDVISMKTFVRWRAKPGSLRVLDVPCSFGTRYVGTGAPVPVY
jgi:hypothetical protein